MALEHALLVSLKERPAAGSDLTRRFDSSIGYFWSATHQQIYRTLRRMEADGWLESEQVVGGGRRERTAYRVTEAGEAELARWLSTPPPAEAVRSDLAVQLRGASYGDRQAVLGTVKKRLADHQLRLGLYRDLLQRDYPQPETLTGQALDQYLVLRGGVVMEEAWIAWLTEYLEAHL